MSHHQRHYRRRQPCWESKNPPQMPPPGHRHGPSWPPRLLQPCCWILPPLLPLLQAPHRSADHTRAATPWHREEGAAAYRTSSSERRIPWIPPPIPVPSGIRSWQCHAAAGRWPVPIPAASPSDPAIGPADLAFVSSFVVSSSFSCCFWFCYCYRVSVVVSFRLNVPATARRATSQCRRRYRSPLPRPKNPRPPRHRCCSSPPWYRHLPPARRGRPPHRPGWP